jgi:peroxiredoxin Q/BCP
LLLHGGRGGSSPALLTKYDGQPVTLTRKSTAARWTFVIGKDGKIVSKNTKVNPAQDSKDILALIEKLDPQ